MTPGYNKAFAEGKRIGLRGRALAVFTSEAGDAVEGEQTQAAAQWRIGASRLKGYEEELAFKALARLLSTPIVVD